MEDKFYIYINNKKIPYPDTLNIEMQELCESEDGHTLDGTMNKNSKGFIYYLTLDYELLASFLCAQLSCIKKSTFVNVKFWNPHENREVTQTMFSGNPTAQHVGWGGRYGNIPLYSYHIELTNKFTRKQGEIPDIEDIEEDE